MVLSCQGSHSFHCTDAPSSPCLHSILHAPSQKSRTSFCFPKGETKQPSKSCPNLRTRSFLFVVQSPFGPSACASAQMLFATPWTVACHAPESMGFSRKEYWSGVPGPPPGDLPNPDGTHISYVPCIRRKILYL